MKHEYLSPISRIWFHIKFVNKECLNYTWAAEMNQRFSFTEEKNIFLLAGFILSTDDVYRSSCGHVSAKHPLTLMSRTWKYVNAVKLITPFIITCLIYLERILSVLTETDSFFSRKYYFGIITIENKWTHWMWFRETNNAYIFNIFLNILNCK